MFSSHKVWTECEFQKQNVHNWCSAETAVFTARIKSPAAQDGHGTTAANAAHS